MSLLAFREELISLSYISEVAISYTDSPSDSKILDWCQVFYLSDSILICKVYSSTLHLSQFFLSVPTNDVQSMKSHESLAKLKISFPGQILPSISFYSDSADYFLFILTSQGKLFKLTFKQNQVFSEDKNLHSMQAYDIEKSIPTCMTLIETLESSFEVCIGMKNGTLLLAAFLETTSNEFIPPFRSRVVEVPINLVKRMKSFVLRKSNNEEALRTALIGKQLILTFNNVGGIRLYDLAQQKYISELELEIGTVVEYKFSCFGNNQGHFLAIGHCKRDKWRVSLIRIFCGNIEVVSQFTEAGILFDLGLNQSGLWMAWGNFHSSRIVLKPFSQENPLVYSAYDEIFKQSIEDEAVLAEEKSSARVVERILCPGRFKKEWISQSMKKVKKVDWEGGDLELSVEEAEQVLNGCKMLDSQSKEVWCLGTCELLGEYPLIVVRGNEKIGVLRRAENYIEKSELIIRKLAVDWNSLASKPELKDFSKFKIATGVQGFYFCLAIVRIWRQKIFSIAKFDFKKQLEELLANHVPTNLLQVLKRHVSFGLNERVIEELHIFARNFSEQAGKNVKANSEFWPKPSLILFGNCLVSSIRSQFEYFFDVTLLLYLSSTSFSTDSEVFIEKSTISDCTSVTLFLFTLLQTLTSPVKLSWDLPNEETVAWNVAIDQFNQYSFPVSISTLYMYTRSDLVLTDKYALDIWNSSRWFDVSLSLSIKDLMNIVYEGPFTSSPGPKLVSCFEDHLMASTNLLSVLSSTGQLEAIKTYYECLDSHDSLKYLFLGKALLAQGKGVPGQQALVKSVAGFLSGNLDSNEKKLAACPVKIEAIYENSEFFSMYNGGLISDSHIKHKEKIIFSELICSSLYGTFTQHKVELSISELIETSNYAEALTLTNAISCNDLKEFTIKEIIEDSLGKDLFSFVLDYPVMFKFKGFIRKFLKEKSRSEVFIVHRTILRERYYEEASGLFLQEYGMDEREYKGSKGVTWTEALYCFALRYSYFNTAACAGYQSYERVKEVYDKMRHRKPEEHEFIKNIMDEYLALTILAARNISEVKEKCWFLVPTVEKDEESMKRERTIKKIIDLVSLEKLLIHS